jgi:glutaminyl-peptide cyclotransferase
MTHSLRHSIGLAALVAVGLLAANGIAGVVSGGEAASIQGARVIAIHPHDPDAFTQGLAFADGLLFEGTGLYGESTLRAVDPTSGRVLRQVSLPDTLFGEGITLWNEEVIQLTWLSGRILRWTRRDFAPLGKLSLPGQGWGLTNDGQHWIVSDGSDTLRFLDPASAREVRRVQVRDGGEGIRRLNELEYIRGEVWANIWYQDRLVRIDPSDGRVLGYVDLGRLWPAAQQRPHDAVLNGIAWDPATGRLFVTGKRWPRLYEIDLDPAD